MPVQFKTTNNLLRSLKTLVILNLFLIAVILGYFITFDLYSFLLVLILTIIFVVLLNIYYSSLKFFYIIFIGIFFVLNLYSTYYTYLSIQYEITWKIKLLSIPVGINSFSFDITLYFDYISISFINLILFISLLVMFYSLNYFKNEQHIMRLYLLLLLFCFSMCLLVSAYNWFLIFLGWELIGLVSFLLINFYSIKTGVLKSSLKAASLNRLSDFFLLSGIMVFLTHKIDSINLILIQTLASQWDLKIGVVLILCSACIKSAQWGFHIWLPDSMEAPVPASALIHSATLVSAGTYLIIRLQPVIILYNDIYIVSLIWFGVTAVLGAYSSSKQTDMKKLLAYSTISHCGFLCATAISGYTIITILYLYLHGIFKAFSFMCAGSFIQAFLTQDMRYMSRGYLILPAETFSLIFSLFNLSALPGSLGSYYKIIFLNSLIISNIDFFILSLFFLASLFSVSYTMQVVKHIFFNEIKWLKPVRLKTTTNTNIYANQGLYYFILIVLIVIFFIKFFILFNFITVDYPFSNSDSYVIVWKCFYSVIIVYCYYRCYLNNLYKSNYYSKYYILGIIFSLLICWEVLIICEILTSILDLHITYQMLLFILHNDNFDFDFDLQYFEQQY